MPFATDLVLRYQLPQQLGELVLADSVIDHLHTYRQKGRYQSEQGGQLFGTFQPGTTRIELATGPRESDRRGRYFFHPNRRAEQEEIDRFFGNGLHYIGDWHTHPEDVPSPSQRDLRSIRSILKESRHELKGIVLIIVGRAQFPRGLHVSVHTTGGSEYRMTTVDNGADDKPDA